MKRITEVEEFEGKVISRAYDTSGGNEIILVFDDETYATVSAHTYPDGPAYVSLHANTSHLELFNAGVISEEEYMGRCADQEKEQESREREQLARLKKKYGC